MKQEQLSAAAFCFGIEVAVIWFGRVLFGFLSCEHRPGYAPRCPYLTWDVDWVALLMVTVPVIAVAWIASQRPTASDEDFDGPKIAIAFIFATTLYPAVAFTNVYLFAIWAVIFVTVYGKRFIAGSHFLFVPHPTESIIARPLETGDAIDHRALGAKLLNEAGDDGSKPHFHYENQAKHARELKQKLDAETAMAEAKTRRERARAALLDAEREVEDAKRRARGKS